MDEHYRKEIESCVEKSMKAENFSKIKIDFTGINGTSEGALSELIFATVTGTDKDNKNKEVHLALKLGQRNEGFRKLVPMLIEFYEREFLFYDTVLPAFHQFQVERNPVNTFDAFPKCYGTVISDHIEALVLEDLKKQGFALHNQQMAMNLQHLQLVLKNYAKFHALSFAFRDQHPHKFKELTANYNFVMRKLLLIWITGLHDDRLQRVFREAGRDDINAKYAEETKNQELTRLLEIVDDVPQESVITHGDCHNNNFLFKYKGDDKTDPIGVAIIDWQLSGIHSPVLDLSYFLYLAASKKEYQIDELLKFYHLHLTDFMTELGSDAQKIFPYSTLVEHWRKYSFYGLSLGRNLLLKFYILEESMPVFTGNKELFDKQWKDVKLQNDHLYTERMISSTEHYFNFKFT